MTYARPSYSDLNTRISADLAAMPAVLREPLAVMWARVGHGLHGHLEWVHKQCSPLTCDEDRLNDWAVLYGVPRLMAIGATGTATASGSPGAIVLAGALLRGPNGLDYSVQEAVEFTGTSATVSVRCVTVGVAGNLAASAQLSMVDTLLGVGGTVIVGGAGLTGGADDETVDAWRLRVADEWQTVTTTGARGGKDDDYRAWAKAAHQSVTTALVQPHVMGIGTVVVRPICNALANRVPTQGVLDAVAGYLSGVAPAVADWIVAAPIPRPVNFNIHLLPGFDTAENRAAIEDSLHTIILAEASETSVFLVAECDAAIQAVTTQYDRIAPAANLAVGAGEVFTFGAVIWS